MLAADPDALLCDLAETYRIYDIHAVPVRMLATLAAGLKEDARINKKISGIKYDLNTLMLAAIADRLTVLQWIVIQMFGADAGRMPDSILEQLISGQSVKISSNMAFSSGEEYEMAREKILSGGGDGDAGRSAGIRADHSDNARDWLTAE